ncbi:MAG: hypothetical protein LBU34_06125, partial [Planctomycetaceae bacterium]|nr:hypothetical protein [Planctomycetaceae bacterium]
IGDSDPAVALRFTAGYAHHTPCGVKISIAVWKQKFVGYRQRNRSANDCLPYEWLIVKRAKDCRPLDYKLLRKYPPKYVKIPTNNRQSCLIRCQ